MPNMLVNVGAIARVPAEEIEILVRLLARTDCHGQVSFNLDDDTRPIVAALAKRRVLKCVSREWPTACVFKVSAAIFGGWEG